MSNHSIVEELLAGHDVSELWLVEIRRDVGGTHIGGVSVVANDSQARKIAETATSGSQIRILRLTLENFTFDEWQLVITHRLELLDNLGDPIEPVEG